MADALVPLLDASEEEIAGSALQASAQVGNPRCLPASIAELAEPRWPYAPQYAVGVTGRVLVDQRGPAEQAMSAWHCPSVLIDKGRPSLDAQHLATSGPHKVPAHLHVPPAVVSRLRYRKSGAATLDEHQSRCYEAVHQRMQDRMVRTLIVLDKRAHERREGGQVDLTLVVHHGAEARRQ
ncbi:MAG TPA: hypothetical protein VGP57_08170 [Actinoplanes sp.]|nr:hypothetical protein [Actinoplanes sp.]